MTMQPPDPDPARIQDGAAATGESGPRRLSDILAAIVHRPAGPDDRISLGDLIDGFGNRAFGVLLFVFAVPVALPIAIPGISAVLGTPLLLVSWQLMCGQDRPWLSELMRKRSFRHRDFAALMNRALPMVRRVERLMRPRLMVLTTGRSERAIGLIAFLLAMILFLPIPFGNSVPALGVAVLALAVLERDGVAAIVGATIGAVGMALVSGIMLAVAKAVLIAVQAWLMS